MLALVVVEWVVLPAAFAPVDPAAAVSTSAPACHGLQVQAIATRADTREIRLLRRVFGG
jgi:hypothetical protein